MFVKYKLTTVFVSFHTKMQPYLAQYVKLCPVVYDSINGRIFVHQVPGPIVLSNFFFFE